MKTLRRIFLTYLLVNTIFCENVEIQTDDMDAYEDLETLIFTGTI